MAKKPKDAQATTSDNATPKNTSSSSDIFDTLFGNIPEQATIDSIFSHSNPFRRKPTVSPQIPPKKEDLQHLRESELGLGSLREDVEVGKNGEYANHDSGNFSKRKREKDKPLKIDLGSGVEEASGVKLEGKRLKQDELRNPSTEKKENLSYELKETSDEPVNMVFNRKEKETKKKKKRKRDEIELEYEERLYGVKDDDGEEGVNDKIVGEKRKKMDRPEDVLVSKESFDDEEKLLRTVFVGNLPLKVKKKVLFREFGKFGDIESVRLRSIPLLDDKAPRKGAIMKKQINDAVDRVNAYIVFITEEAAQASLSYNMGVVGGNHIHVDRACPPRKKLRGDNAPLYDNKRTVFIGNLPFDVKDEELYQLFSGINNLKFSIEAIRVIRDPGTSMGKGIAYVLFKTREAANVVVRKHNLKIRDRELRLYHATANSSPSKRKLSPPFRDYSSPAKKLALGSGTTPATPENSRKAKTKNGLSYQGMRASKSGVQKKAPLMRSVKPEQRTNKEPKQKECTGKRPAVAARKAASNALKGGGGSIAGAKKRKLDSGTPQSTSRKKKARRFG